MPRHELSIGYRMRLLYPHRSLAAAVLLRARRDRRRGYSIAADERDRLRWWATRAGAAPALVDPFLFSIPASSIPDGP